MTTPNQRRPDYWLSEASYRLQRYMQRPEQGTLDPLLQVLAEYRLLVQSGVVDAPRFPDLNRQRDQQT